MPRFDPSSDKQPKFSAWLVARAGNYVCECPDLECAGGPLGPPHHDPYGCDKTDRSQVLLTPHCHRVAHGRAPLPDGWTRQQFAAHLQARAAQHWRDYEREQGSP